MEIGGKRREGYIKLQMEMTNDKKNKFTPRTLEMLLKVFKVTVILVTTPFVDN